MLSKRIFLLTCILLASWLIWVRLRQRHDEVGSTNPQLAPPRPLAPPIPAAAPTPEPDSNEKSATPPAPTPLRTDTAPAIAESANLTADAPAANDAAETEISGYCMRCKTKRPIQNAHRETTESGRPAA